MASCRAHHNNNKSTTVKQIAQTDAHCKRAGKTGVLWASLIDCGRCFPTRAARRASCGVRGQLRSMHRSLAAGACSKTHTERITPPRRTRTSTSQLPAVQPQRPIHHQLYRRKSMVQLWLPTGLGMSPCTRFKQSAVIDPERRQLTKRTALL